MDISRSSAADEPTNGSTPRTDMSPSPSTSNPLGAFSGADRVREAIEALEAKARATSEIEAAVATELQKAVRARFAPFDYSQIASVPENRDVLETLRRSIVREYTSALEARLEVLRELQRIGSRDASTG